jgi:hypothetical protein
MHLIILLEQKREYDLRILFTILVSTIYMLYI